MKPQFPTSFKLIIATLLGLVALVLATSAQTVIPTGSYFSPTGTATATSNVSINSGQCYGFTGVTAQICSGGGNALVFNSSAGTPQFFFATSGSNQNKVIGSTANLIQFLDSTGVTGQEFNNGSVTLGTCTGGSLTSGSHAFGGEVTGTTGGSCAINFSTSYTNAPFCTATDESATPTALQLSARATNTITIANITSGHNFTYECSGRIGT